MWRCLLQQLYQNLSPVPANHVQPVPYECERCGIEYCDGCLDEARHCPTCVNELEDEAEAEANRPKLRFTPTAWAKLKFLRDLGPTDLLLIKDVRLVPQQAHPAFVVFDDHAVADYFDEQVDRDLRPEQFGRIWIHTHPGESPAPSVTDHETFDRVFGATQWSVMFILARHGATHAELRYQAGPSVDGPTGSLL